MNSRKRKSRYYRMVDHYSNWFVRWDGSRLYISGTFPRPFNGYRK